MPSILDASKNFDQDCLYSAFGTVRAKGTKAEKLVFKEANAYGNIELEHVAVEGRVLSDFGSVYAANSALGNVVATNQVTLKNSVAKRVSSLFGGVAIEQDSPTDFKIASIAANRAIRLKGAFVEGGIRSEFGAVKAKKSTLQKVEAFGNITIKNTSAIELSSNFGKVTVRQTDGTKRSIAHITARGEVEVSGSVVDDVTLHVSQEQKGVIDFKNSEIGKIVVKVDNISSKSVSLSSLFWGLFGYPISEPNYFYANINGKEFHSLDAYRDYQRTGRVRDDAALHTKHFSLLIKGDEMPKNISFEGFETDEISSEKTDEGILVKGEKKREAFISNES